MEDLPGVSKGDRGRSICSHDGPIGGSAAIKESNIATTTRVHAVIACMVGNLKGCVSSAAPSQIRRAIATNQRVLAASRIQRIVSGTGEQRGIARPSQQQIALPDQSRPAAARNQAIAAAAGLQRVAANTAIERIAPPPACR